MFPAKVSGLDAPSRQLRGETWIPTVVEMLPEQKNHQFPYEYLLLNRRTNGAKRIESFDMSIDSSLVINTFLLEFKSPDAAAMGYGIVDAALRPPSPDGTIRDLSHAAGPQIGSSLSTLTSISY